MKRFSLLGLGLMLVLLAATATATSASAEVVQPSNLPEGVKAMTGESDGTNPTFHSKEGDIVCTSAPALETSESSNKPPLGLFHIHFKGCEQTVLKVKCTGTGEEAGVILALGKWHLYFDRKVGGVFEKLTTATVFLVEPVSFKCSAVLALKVEGEVVCLDLKPETAARDFLFHCTGKSSTEPDEEYCRGGDELKAGTEGICLEPTLPKLTESINGGAAQPATELALGLVLYEVNVTGMI
jgi:hypothetical protein